MPNTTGKSRRGGIGSRNRRRRRRSNKPRPFGPIYTLTTRYHQRIVLTSKSGWSIGFFDFGIGIGNKQVFADRWAHLKSTFREYLVTSAQIRLNFQLVKTSSWTAEQHPDIATFGCAAFIEDYEVQVVSDKASSITWDSLIEHPEVRHGMVMSGRPRTLTITWKPSEPSDIEWRLTHNDGIFWLYLIARPFDYATTAQQCEVDVDIRFHLKLRNLDVQDTDELTSPLQSAFTKMRLNETEKSCDARDRDAADRESTSSSYSTVSHRDMA